MHFFFFQQTVNQIDKSSSPHTKPFHMCFKLLVSTLYKRGTWNGPGYSTWIDVTLASRESTPLLLCDRLQDTFSHFQVTERPSQEWSPRNCPNLGIKPPPTPPRGCSRGLKTGRFPRSAWASRRALFAFKAIARKSTLSSGGNSLQSVSPHLGSTSCKWDHHNKWDTSRNRD